MTIPTTTAFSRKKFLKTFTKISDKFRTTFLRQRLTILSVSLLNGRFKAMSIINDSIHQCWESPGIVVRPEAIRQAISNAIYHTQYPGTAISILVDSKQFMTHTLQLPLMPLTDLLPILERKTQEMKTCEGPGIWRYQLGIHARGQQTVHLEIWPQDFVENIVQICEELGLQLQQLAPLTALSESQLSSIPIEPGEAALLVSILEGKVMFVAGEEDGSPLIIRHLAPAQDWVPLGERVGTEINRTIMFINQQTNLNIPQVWFLDEESRLTIGEVQPHISTPLLPCPINPDWKYWLWVGAILPIRHATNFTPVHVHRASWKNLLTKSAAAAIAGILFFSVGTGSMIEGYFAKNQEHIQAIAQERLTLEQDQQQLHKQLVDLQNTRQWIRTVADSTTPLLEGPFLGYLGTILPQSTILQKVSITRRNTSWDVELTGSIATSLSKSLSLLEQFTNQLAEGPYHMTVQNDWRNQLLTQTTTSSPLQTSAPRYRFTLKGRII